MHALRHFYASVLLDAGENIKALSLYLGHANPGFTLRVYTHLMQSRESRTRDAVDGLYEGIGSPSDGPELLGKVRADGHMAVGSDRCTSVNSALNSGYRTAR